MLIALNEDAVTTIGDVFVAMVCVVIVVVSCEAMLVRVADPVIAASTETPALPVGLPLNRSRNTEATDPRWYFIAHARCTVSGESAGLRRSGVMRSSADAVVMIEPSWVIKNDASSKV